MPYRISTPVAPPTAQEQRQTQQLGDLLRQLTSSGRFIEVADVQGLLAQASRDRQLRPEEVGLIAQTLRSRPDSFSPEAAAVLEQFLAQFAGEPEPVPVEPMAAPRGWSPTANDPSNIKGLRQELGMLFKAAKPITANQAQVLIHRALQHGPARAQGFGILKEAFEANKPAFSPEAKSVLENFIRSGLGEVSKSGGLTGVQHEAWDTTRSPQGAGRPQLGGGAVAKNAEQARQLTGLRDLFVELISNDGEMSVDEVEQLKRAAGRSGWVEGAEVQLLAQGYRDNASRFTPEAAMAMEQFLARYGY